MHRLVIIKSFLSVLIFIIQLFKKRECYCAYFKACVRTFLKFCCYRYVRFGIKQKSKIIRAGPVSVAGAYSCLFVFYKSGDPDVSLLSPAHTHIHIHTHSKHGFMSLLHTHKIVQSSFTNIWVKLYKTQAVPKYSYYKVLSKQIYLNHS